MTRKINPIDEKFIESFELDDWEIETEDGWKDLTHLHKTIPYYVWELSTINYSLRCADDHIVMVEGFKEKFVKDLTLEDKVITKTGLEQVVSVKKLDIDKDNMFDVTVDSENHTLFTNGILSHNTTTSSIYLLWYALFNKDKTIAILANKESTAIEILDRIKLAYRHLPLWMQQGIVDGGWNKKSVKLGNGVKIMASTTSQDSISGETISLLYLDEFAKVKEHVAEEFITATYPVISSGQTSKIIIVSTPLGMNHFYEFWQKAVNGESNFFPVSVPWHEHPKRDQKWKEDTIKDIGNIRFAQEFGCKFLGTASTLIDSDALEMTQLKQPVSIKWTGLFNIYEEPRRGVLYILGVDTAKGTGGDSSVVQVLKINHKLNIEQVAIYRNNLINPHDFAQVVISISQYYFNAQIMVENNDVGSSVCDTIWYEFENENLLSCDSKLEIVDGKSKKVYMGLGIRSTRKSKLEANILLKEYFEKGWLTICDPQTLYELSRYEEVKPNVFSCGRDVHDDTITALLWGLYFVKTDYYEESGETRSDIDREYKIEDKKRKDYEEDDNAEPPAIIFD